MDVKEQEKERDYNVSGQVGQRDYSMLGLDGQKWEGTVLLTGEADIFYFTGFYTTARRPKQIGMTAVILASGVKKFVYPRKWQGQIEEQELSGLGEPVPYENTKEAYLETLTELLRREDMSLLWIVYDQTDLPTYLALRPLARMIKDMGPKMAELRLIKSQDEIRRIKQAAAIAADAMEYAKTSLRAGITELEAAAEIEYHMRRNGSDGVPFTMKLISGRRSAVVTRVPEKKRIERGDLVLLDFGAKYLGYSSDWTRTFCISECTKEQRSLYELVRYMESECIKMVRPDLPMQELLKKAADIAAGHPYGKYFNPHLGHSVGITSHEWPTIDENVSGRLQENMVITIEPGVYVPGLGGVRIEDEVLVTERGYEILTGLKEETFVLS